MSAGGCSAFCVCDRCTAKVAASHRDADEACGRDWETGGCQCAACRRYRAVLKDVNDGFARIEALQNDLARVRLAKACTTPETSPREPKKTA